MDAPPMRVAAGSAAQGLDATAIRTVRSCLCTRRHLSFVGAFTGHRQASGLGTARPLSRACRISYREAGQAKQRRARGSVLLRFQENFTAEKICRTCLLANINAASPRMLTMTESIFSLPPCPRFPTLHPRFLIQATGPT